LVQRTKSATPVDACVITGLTLRYATCRWSTCGYEAQAADRGGHVYSSEPRGKAAARLFSDEGYRRTEQWTRCIDDRNALRRIAQITGRRLDRTVRAGRHVS